MVSLADSIRAVRESNIPRSYKSTNPIANCITTMNQNPCGHSDSGILPKFMPHMPLTTTNGMLMVAMTDKPLVMEPSRFETCVK